jgi:GTPase SAR1 family protein
MRLLPICFLFGIVYAAASQPILRYKVVVVGEAGVGKSSLTVRLANGAFFENLETTTGGTVQT